MTNRTRFTVRREPRFTVRLGKTLTVLVRSAERGELAALLVDISKRGAKLRCDQTLPTGEHVQLTLKESTGVEPLSIPARIVWSHLSCGATFRMGCYFTDLLEDRAIDQLVTAGYLERRQHPRLETNLAVNYRWELKSISLSAQVLNISQGGFCLLAPEPGTVNHRLLITWPQDPHQLVPARAVWQQPTDRGFLIGCQLLSADSFPTLLRWHRAAHRQAVESGARMNAASASACR